MPTPKPDKVVLDTNILVSLIITRKTHELTDWVAENGVTIYACPELLNELRTTFEKPGIRKFLTSPSHYYVDFVASLCEITPIEKRFDRAPDPDDNYLFDLAYTVKAHYLVTGERVLLNMKHVNPIRIISLKDFRAIIKGLKQDK